MLIQIVVTILIVGLIFWLIVRCAVEANTQGRHDCTFSAITGCASLALVPKTVAAR